MKPIWLMAVALAACATRETLPLTTTGATVDAVATEKAIRGLTSERCNRQLSCDNIGPGHKWNTLDACMDEMRRVTRDQLVSRSCGAVDAGQLATCLDNTRNQRCEELGDGVDACTSTLMCK